MRVSVVVLGDLGRSPRMLNHARALARQGVDVDLIGYAGSVAQRFLDDPRIQCHVLPAVPDLPAGVRYYAAGLRRVRTQARGLRAALARVPRPDLILVQTPPAVPTLWVARAAARRHRARLVIDWHNLTYRVLALRLGAGHPLVRLVHAYERLAARSADMHLCVSSAMRDALKRRWRLTEVHVVRDRPLEIHTAAGADRAALIDRAFGPRHSPAPPALVVVPTSWSLDDDFDLLLEALDICASLMAAHDRAHPARPCRDVLVLLTGRGPARERYQARFGNRPGSSVRARALWLEPDEYPRAIACADLGVSIHRSASGLDLPMKITDMFGAGVPVCALDYGACLRELMTDGQNGVLFRSAAELGQQLFDLTQDAARLTRLRQHLAASPRELWHDGWMREAAPVLNVPVRMVVER